MGPNGHKMVLQARRLQRIEGFDDDARNAAHPKRLVQALLVVCGERQRSQPAGGVSFAAPEPLKYGLRFCAAGTQRFLCTTRRFANQVLGVALGSLKHGAPHFRRFCPGTAELQKDGFSINVLASLVGKEF